MKIRRMIAAGTMAMGAYRAYKRFKHEPDTKQSRRRR